MVDTVRNVASHCAEPLAVLQRVAHYAETALLRQQGQPPEFVDALVGDFIRDYKGTWYLTSIKAAKVSGVPVPTPGRPIRRARPASARRSDARDEGGKMQRDVRKLPVRGKGLGRGCKGDYCGTISRSEAADGLRARMYALGKDGARAFEASVRRHGAENLGMAFNLGRALGGSKTAKAVEEEAGNAPTSSMDRGDSLLPPGMAYGGRRTLGSPPVVVGGVGTTSEDLRLSYTEVRFTSSAPVLAPHARPASAAANRMASAAERGDVTAAAAANMAGGTGGHIPYRMISQDRATGCVVGTEPEWFWQADDGVTWVPYDQDSQRKLEDALELGFRSIALNDSFTVTFRKCAAGNGVQYLFRAGGPYMPDSLSRRVKREPSPHSPLLPRPTRTRQAPSASIQRTSQNHVPAHALCGAAAPAKRESSLYACGYEPYDQVYVCHDCYRVYLAKEQVRRLRVANVIDLSAHDIRKGPPPNPFAVPEKSSENEVASTSRAASWSTSSPPRLSRSPGPVAACARLSGMRSEARRDCSWRPRATCAHSPRHSSWGASR